MRQPEERDLPDLHVRVDRDRQVRDVRQLEREVAVPPGVDVAGGRVDQQPETPEARLALQPRDQVVGQRHPLDRRAEHELARVQDEGLVAGDLDHLGQVRHLRDGRRCTGTASWRRRGTGGRRAGRRTRAGRMRRRTGRSRCGPPRAPCGCRRSERIIAAGCYPFPEDATQRSSVSTAAPESIDAAAIASPSSQRARPARDLERGRRVEQHDVASRAGLAAQDRQGDRGRGLRVTAAEVGDLGPREPEVRGVEHRLAELAVHDVVDQGGAGGRQLVEAVQRRGTASPASRAGRAPRPSAAACVRRRRRRPARTVAPGS